jgi:hypothetical protein
MTSRRLPVLVLLALLLCGLATTAARASTTQLSVMMDDDELVYRGDQVRDATLTRMKELGVDEVRVTVLWSVIADKAQKGKARRKRFHKLGAANPKAYPKLNWDRYDRLDRACKTLGIGCYFDVTGPGPSWGHERAPHKYRKDRATWKPKAREFKLFVEAVGKRYSGTYKDENDNHVVLPRISFWSLWNEPNQGGWLTPQFVGGRPYSPMLFRRLYISGRQGLVATGHAGDTILLGETAPLGWTTRTDRSAMGPLTFARALFCVDAQGRPAGGPGCSDFSHRGPLLATAWAHHPYSKTTPPTSLFSDSQAITDDNSALTMFNISQLTGFLDKVAANSGRIAPNLPVALTEFGYETNPPDPYAGLPLDKQADYLNLADLLGWVNPRIMATTQFLLRDAPPLTNHTKGSKAYWHTYQSGLFFANGTPKPAASAYRLPLAAFPFARDPANNQVVEFVWGQLRFRPKGAPDQVTLLYKPADGSSDWAPLGSPVMVNDSRNFFTARVDVPGPGQLQVQWQGLTAPFQANSRVVAVG